MDRALFYSINGWPDSLNPVFQFFSEGSKWLWVRLLLVAILVLLIGRPKTRAPALLAAVCWPVANGITDLLKHGFQHLRPCVELPDAIVRVNLLTSFGTASAHSANMAAVAFCFMRYHRPLGWTWLVVAFLTGLSRVYVGVHYPYQVALGWLVGAFVGWGATSLYEVVRRKKANRQQEIRVAES